MVKHDFLNLIKRLYRVGNNADSEYKEDWTKPSMAGWTCCAHLDMLLHDMEKDGIITAAEKQWLYDTL